MSGRPIISIARVFLSLLVTISVLAKADQTGLRIGYLGENTESAFLGVQQGLLEANVQGQSLGQNYKLQTIANVKKLPTDIIAVIVASDAETLEKLSKRHPDLSIFNLTMENDELREACFGNVLHIIPSTRMKGDAVAQWHEKYPNKPVFAQAWHHDLKTSAGSELNKRFKEAQGQPMDDEAWAGWAAVRILSESVSRAQSSDPKRLLEYIKTELSFDGQKGIDMDIRATGQLRQVLLIVEDDEIVGEAPVTGIADPTGLDSIGLVECPEQ